uniref:N-acetylneuraminate synthase n=1 Tax=Rheinheimera sp. BAL341 TaxID=1708203 RepID=A0A486XVH7_9GAMM
MTNKTYIIAEAGVNHNGDIALAKQLVDAAVQAGADAVKFQTFKADLLVTKDTPKAGYQARNTGEDNGQYAMLKALELTEQQHVELHHYCQLQGIDFMSTPFDVKSMHFLLQFNMPFLKIPSGEVNNALLLWHAARTGLPIILSTGMATLADIEYALAVILYGRHNPKLPTGLTEIFKFRSTLLAQGVTLENIMLLHCTTQYPTPLSDVNLKAIPHLNSTFGLPVGYSDHSDSVLVPALAVANGAVCVEKHFTLSRSMKGPDHAASMEPDELKQMIKMIRETEVVQGRAIKFPQTYEFDTQQIARQRLVTRTPIKCGESFTCDNVTTARSPRGLSAIHYWDLINTHAERDYNEMDAICMIADQ